MYERFTDRSRKALQIANQEAQRCAVRYIGTEHLLIGIIKEGSGIAAAVLKNINIDIHAVRLEVEKHISYSTNAAVLGRLPHTSSLQKSLMSAMAEAASLNHNYIGTEHLLLGLLTDHDGITGAILSSFGITPQIVRDQTLKILQDSKPSDPSKYVSFDSLRAQRDVKFSAPTPKDADFVASLRTFRAELVAMFTIVDSLLKSSEPPHVVDDFPR